jgi:DNA polymerase-1
MYDCFYPINYTLGQNAWFYLTGSGNFRKDLATIKVYKGQRPPKPEHLPATRDQLVQQWGAEIVEGQEADDAIGIKATDLKGDCTIVSIDKDLLMIPGTHYNFVKKEWTEVSQEKGDYFFYKQLLTGDQVDNIQGVPGIGPKKAEKAYEGCTTVQEMYQKALEMYKGDANALLENARLLWLRRYEGEMWEPPV